jgi:Plasma-membrane choline transporter
MHVTTAGVVGTWWFVPAEANSFWSPALSDSACRATTYSFGSICFGSLLVALIQALRALEHHTRGNDDFQFLSCIIQCILGCLESILEGINRWAYGKFEPIPLLKVKIQSLLT